MKRSRTRKPPALPAQPTEEARRIDERYGLEPLFEPDAGDADESPSGTAQFQSLQCPYCGERFEVLLDLSAGSARYIEDCQVCCQPIELDIELDHEGTLIGVRAQRSA